MRLYKRRWLTHCSFSSQHDYVTWFIFVVILHFDMNSWSKFILCRNLVRDGRISNNKVAGVGRVTFKQYSLLWQNRATQLFSRSKDVTQLSWKYYYWCFKSFKYISARWWSITITIHKPFCVCLNMIFRRKMSGK